MAVGDGGPPVLWSPPADVLDRSRIGAYLRWLERERGLTFAGYPQLWQWSVGDTAAFWRSIWDYFEVAADGSPDRVRVGASMPGVSWFPDTRLNYAENVLRAPGLAAGAPVVLAYSQSRPPITLTVAQLREQVRRVHAGLLRLGVREGDRVAAYLPNIPETLVLLLATASLGATFSSCAPEFGTRSVLDRWRQIEPVVLVAVDGYRYGAKRIDRRAEVEAIAGQLPSLRHVVTLSYLEPAGRADAVAAQDGAGAAGAPPAPAGSGGLDAPGGPGSRGGSGALGGGGAVEGGGAVGGPARSSWAGLATETAEPLTFSRVPFGHPLYVLYSSGTTGLPKPIVHGHGGILLEHLKMLALHHDLGPADRFFWFSTTGWMMWNYLVSAPAVGAAIVLFDGDPAAGAVETAAAVQESPTAEAARPARAQADAAGQTAFDGSGVQAGPGRIEAAGPGRIGHTGPGRIEAAGAGRADLGALWRMAAAAGVTYFGTSAPFLLACRKAGLVPREVADLSRLRAVGSTGAPLPAEGFRWVYEAVGGAFMLHSLSGGTDVCTGFVGGSPLHPVRPGEIACRCLGARVEAYDPAGRPVIGQLGELVVTEAMPSMPVGFWGDPDGVRYRESYFDVYPGVWRHGDWITISEAGACVITGRSDATLNRGGVRLGTAEFYSVVEALPEVVDSMVVHLEDGQGGAGELLLFVVLADGVTLDDPLRSTIAGRLRGQLSPRHVPDEIHQVRAVPRTLSAKKLEVPVKKILTGTPVAAAAAGGALVDPGALDAFAELAAGRLRGGFSPGSR